MSQKTWYEPDKKKVGREFLSVAARLSEKRSLNSLSTQNVQYLSGQDPTSGRTIGDMCCLCGDGAYLSGKKFCLFSSIGYQCTKKSSSHCIGY